MPAYSRSRILKRAFDLSLSLTLSLQGRGDRIFGLRQRGE
jgi:hypothetical protein